MPNRPLLPLAALLLILVGGVAGAQPVEPFETADPVTLQHQVDRLVLARLTQLKLKPEPLCSDAVFIRRVYLDLIGTLPTPQETRAFLDDPKGSKRRDLIDQLLARPEFADYWAMKWSDLLRLKAEFPINLWPNAAQAYHHWLRESFAANRPFDQMAREMLTASGSNFRVPAVNFWRAVQSREPQVLAQTVALTFLGERAEKWDAKKLSAFAAVFSQLGYKSTGEWKEEIVFFDPSKPLPPGATLPDGSPLKLNPGQDPREAFAAWLIQNPAFSRAIANRAWCWFFGRGIVHEADDFRTDNPPSNPELLAYLQQQVVASKYDLKAVFRLICNTQTYQRSSISRSKDPLAEANFAYYPMRRLDAEVLADAICQITGTNETYTSAIPEPFTFIPADLRSIALPDGSISSAFLEQFGRPPRDSGTEAERVNRSTPSQRLHLLNSSHIQRKLDRGKSLQVLLNSGKKPDEKTTEIYLLVLSRYPTGNELQVARQYGQSAAVKPREAAMDLVWALINSQEFLYRH
jgi:hypothetical protein